jgi:hypothetical protein
MRRVTLDKIIRELNWCIKGWVNAYRFCNLSKDDLSKIDYHVGKRLRGWLLRRGIIEKPKKIDGQAYRWLGVEEAASIHILPLLKREGKL